MPPADFHPDQPDAQRTLRVLAEAAARAGGDVARRYFGTTCKVRLKADQSEVTEADRAAQAAVIAVLRASRPHDAIIAEEELELSDPSPAPTNDNLCWAIDPLDGTRNFVRGIPLYVCSVAALVAGVPLVGAIYDPLRDRLYSASRAEGFFVDVEPQASRLDSAPLPAGRDPRPVVALPSTPTGPIAATARAWLERFICRNLGSTALHLAMVATGQLDAMLADNPRLWDVAAGWVMITAVGGRLTGPAGNPLFPLDVGRYSDEEMPLIAAGPKLHAQLIQDAAAG